MILAGITGRDGKVQTSNLIHIILVSTGKKVSVVDSRSLLSLDSKRIRNYIQELAHNRTDILLIRIHMSDMEKVIDSELHFDMMIYTEKEEEIGGANNTYNAALMDKLHKAMAEKGIAIVNVDDMELVHLLQGIKQPVVTYGFNPKASITTSSIGDTVFKDGLICCQQRTISATNGEILEPQEYKLRLDSGDADIHNVLAAATFAIVNGIDLNQVGAPTP